MSVISYYVSVNTGVDYEAEAYDTAAGTLINMLSTVFSSKDTLVHLTHDNTLLSATTEIEVSLQGTPRELVGEAVLDITSVGKMSFDKARLSKLLKASTDASLWPAMKITKKVVPQSESNIPEESGMSSRSEANSAANAACEAEK
tara:strand:+ start:143 stop:577 length:435 start_codon:yes stop_codon:yes gene_type:complete